MAKIWCGYCGSNTKSRHVQKKTGFRYQWRFEGVDVPLMYEKRICHVSNMTMEEWKAEREIRI